ISDNTTSSWLGVPAESFGNIVSVGTTAANPADSDGKVRNDLVFVKPTGTGAQISIVPGTALPSSDRLTTATAGIKTITLSGPDWSRSDLQVQVLDYDGTGTDDLLVLLPSRPDSAGVGWTSAASMASSRMGHTATLLGNGKVLVAGGTNGTSPVASAELYDPATNTWSAAAPMSAARQYHTATLLPNGKVLVAGGTNGTS